MIRIGLGLSVCDRCGSVVYEPVTTTTTQAAPETTLYLTEVENYFGTDLSLTHEAFTFTPEDDGEGNYYLDVVYACYKPIASSTWGEWGGTLKITLSGVASTINETVYLSRADSKGSTVTSAVMNVSFVNGVNNIIVPVTDWDVQVGDAEPSDSDVLTLEFNMFQLATPITLVCTNPTDTYLTLDAELDPQPWPVATTTTTTP